VTWLNWLLGLMVAGAAAVVAAPVLGARHAPTAGAVLLLAPIVGGRLAFPTDELAPAALLLAAAAAWWRGAVEFGGARWLRLAAILIGGALGPAWVFAIALFLVWKCAQQPAPGVDRSGRRGATRQNRDQGCEQYDPHGVAAHGSGASVDDPPTIDRDEYERIAGIAIVHGPAAAASAAVRRAPGILALVGCVIGAIVSGGAGQTLVECFGPRWLGCGPLLLAAAPGVWWTRRLCGMRRLTLGIVTLVAGAAMFAPRVAAVLLAALLATTAIWVWIELQRFPALPRILARVGLALLASVTAWTTLAGDDLCWPPRLSTAGREQYLADRLGSYRAARVANEVVRGSDRVLTNDASAYWIRCRVMDQCQAEATWPDEPIERPISAMLREQRITHLLLVGPASAASSAADANGADLVVRSAPTSRLADLVDRELESGDACDLVPLVEYTQASPAGSQRYRLIAVRREPAGQSQVVAQRDATPIAEGRKSLAEREAATEAGDGTRLRR
jgi:hypothetical protein